MDQTVDIKDIERQQRWEARNVEAGVERYRRTIAQTDLANTPPGVLASRDMLKTLIPAIEEAQDEAVEGIRNAGRGCKVQWWWLIGFLSADKLGVITSRVILTDRADHKWHTRPVTSIAQNIGTDVKLEIEFEKWRKDEQEASKQDPNRTNMHKLLTSRVSEVDTRTFKRWKRKLSTIESEEWTKDMKLQVGTKLVDLAVKHGGGWFEKRAVFRQGKSVRVILLTDVARQAISDINARLEINRPFLMPMLCPPKPWRRSYET